MSYSLEGSCTGGTPTKWIFNFFCDFLVFCRVKVLHWPECKSCHRKTLYSAKHKNAKKSENPLHGSTSCAASLRRAAHQTAVLVQSLWEPHSLKIGGKTQGDLTGLVCGSVCRGGAKVSSIRRRSPWVNLRWSLRVGAWNVLSLREDNHLSLLSSERKRLNIGILGVP